MTKSPSTGGRNGYTAWVNGIRVTSTATTRSAAISDITARYGAAPTSCIETPNRVELPKDADWYTREIAACDRMIAMGWATDRTYARRAEAVTRLAEMQ